MHKAMLYLKQCYNVVMQLYGYIVSYIVIFVVLLLKKSWLSNAMGQPIYFFCSSLKSKKTTRQIYCQHSVIMCIVANIMRFVIICYMFMVGIVRYQQNVVICMCYARYAHVYNPIFCRFCSIAHKQKRSTQFNKFLQVTMETQFVNIIMLINLN